MITTITATILSDNTTVFTRIFIHDSHLFLTAVEEENAPLATITNLHDKVSSAEVRDGPGEARAPPDEAQEERTLCVGEGLHHLPEPLDERRRRLHALVGGHRLEQVQRDVRATTHLETEGMEGTMEGEIKKGKKKNGTGEGGGKKGRE